MTSRVVNFRDFLRKAPFRRCSGICSLWTLGVLIGLISSMEMGIAAPPVTGKGDPCKIVYDIRTDPATISDHTSFDNAPVGNVRMRKPCSGPVVGTFSAELNGNVHIHERQAICITNGGYARGCVSGTIINAPIGHVLLQSNGSADVSFPVETVTWVWPQVPPGEWQFKLLPAVLIGPATVINSTFTVEAFDRF